MKAATIEVRHVNISETQQNKVKSDEIQAAAVDLAQMGGEFCPAQQRTFFIIIVLTNCRK